MKRLLILLTALLLAVSCARAEDDWARDPDLMQAVDMLEQSGIRFAVRGLEENRLYFDLEGGGSMYYLHLWKFNRYDLRQWYPQGMTEAETGLWIDHCLRMAAQVERGDAPEEHLRPDYHGDLGLRNMEATVSNILSGLESLGDVALNHALARLAERGPDEALNSLWARLASRIMGDTDATPVDPALGLAWYDALSVSAQAALPRMEASHYEADPLRCAAAQALIDASDADYATWGSTNSLDWGLTRNVVALKEFRRVESADRATLWANVSQSCYALYGGARAKLVSGSWIPCRLELVRDGDGQWALREIIRAQDGTEYAPSIRAFCDGDRKLADRMMQEGYASTDDALRRCLDACGLEGVAIMD